MKLAQHKKWLIILGLAIAVLAIGAALWLNRGALPWSTAPSTAPHSSTYTPPTRDSNAMPLDAWGAPEGLPQLSTDNYSLSLNPELHVDAAGGCAIWFANDAANSVYLMLDLRAQETGLLLYRTGLIAPGEGIAALTLSTAARAQLSTGAQAVTLTIYSFATDGYTSMGEVGLNTQLTYDGEVSA